MDMNMNVDTNMNVDMNMITNMNMNTNTNIHMYMYKVCEHEYVREIVEDYFCSHCKIILS